MGLLYDPNNPSEALILTRFESDCSKLQLQPVRAPARKAEEMAAAFITLTRYQAQGLIVTANSTNSASQASIIAHVAKHPIIDVRIPENGYSTQTLEKMCWTTKRLCGFQERPVFFPRHLDLGANGKH